MDVRDVLGALKRRRFWLIGAPLTFLAIAGAYAVLARPAYTATAQLFVDPRDRHTPKDDPLQNAVPGDGLLLVESQLKIITSDEVLLRVVEKAHLERDPEFNGERTGLIRKALTVIGLAKPIDPKLTALRNLQLRTATKRIDRSFVIDVMASADTADRATLIANTLAASYLEEQAGADASYNRRLSESISGRLEKLRLAVTQSEDAVAAFKAEHNLVGSRSRLVTEQQLDEANTQLTNARTRLADAQARLRLVDSVRNAGAGLESIPDVIQSATMVQLRARAADIAREEAQLSLLDGPLHPALRSIQAQRRELQTAIRNEVARIAQAVHNTASSEKANVQTLQEAFEALKEQAQANEKLLVPLRQLERTAEANRAIYENYLAKAKSAEQQQAIDKSNVRLITRATPPEHKSWPPTMLMLAAALLGGLLLGVAIALMRDYLDSGDVKETEQEADTPPQPALEREPQLRRVAGELRREPIGYTVVFLRLAPEPCLDLLPLEVAKDLRSEGAEVLLIDADVTRRRLTRRLGLDKQAGLGDLLSRGTPLDGAMHFQAELGFEVMPTGPVTRIETDASARRTLANALKALREFDNVLIDGGVIGAFPPHLGLYGLANELILLVSAQTDETHVEETARWLESQSRKVSLLFVEDAPPHLALVQGQAA